MLFGQLLGRGHGRRHDKHTSTVQGLLKVLGERLLVELFLAEPLHKILHGGLAYVVTLVREWDAFDDFSY